MLWGRIFTTMLFSAVTSAILVTIINRSNLSPMLIIPLIVALLAKYVLGDWDEGYQWTLLDIPYWASILGPSYLVVYLMTGN